MSGGIVRDEKRIPAFVRIVSVQGLPHPLTIGGEDVEDSEGGERILAVRLRGVSV